MADQEDFKPVNTDDLASPGILDPDDGIAIMDNDAIARENEWANEFREGTTATVADVVDDKEDAKGVLPGAPVGDDEGGDDKKPEEEKEDGLTDELFENALTADEQKDVDDLNKRFGTDYKDMKSFREKFKKEEKVDEKAAEIETKERVVEYLEKLVGATPEELYYQDLRVQAHNAGKDVQDVDLDAGFKAKVEEANANGTLDFIGRSLRAEAENKLAMNKSAVQGYRESQVQTETQKKAERKEQLKEATTKLYKQGNFYGLEQSQDKLMKAYRDSSNKTLIKELEANPELLVEMTLLYENREGLAKLSNSPSYSAGVKATFDAIKGQKSKQSVKVVTDSGQGSDLPSYISDWLK